MIKQRINSIEYWFQYSLDQLGQLLGRLVCQLVPIMNLKKKVEQTSVASWILLNTSLNIVFAFNMTLSWMLLLFSFSGIDDPAQMPINVAIVDTINSQTGNFRINRRLENCKYLLLSTEIWLRVENNSPLEYYKDNHVSVPNTFTQGAEINIAPHFQTKHDRKVFFSKLRNTYMHMYAR